MVRILDLVQLKETIELSLLILLLLFISEKVARPDSTVFRYARWLSAAIFVVYLITGFAVERPTGLGDIVLNVLRAALASGLAFGVTTLSVGLLAIVVGDPWTAFNGWRHRVAAQNQQRTFELKARTQQRERERSAMVEHARQKPIKEQEQRRAAKAAAGVERERHSWTDEARAEVLRYYDQHKDVLAETMPPSLLRSRLQTKFPPCISPADAWQAAQDLINEMLPLVAVGREKHRARQEEARKLAEQAKDEERRRTDAEERRNAFQKLADWYQREKRTILELLPEGLDRDDALIGQRHFPP